MEQNLISGKIDQFISHGLSVKFSRKKRTPQIICMDVFHGSKRVYSMEYEAEPDEPLDDQLLNNMLHHVMYMLALRGQYPYEVE